MNSKEENSFFVPIMSRNSASAQYVHRARVTLPPMIGEEKPWTKKYEYRARIRKSLSSPGIDSKKSIPPAYLALRADTPNRVVVLARHATEASGIDSLESITGLLKRLQT